ncbi:MAG: hypothetical protein DMG73_16210 [Acidobacteria bacterium]|nr:MAG: hypothetical protein DMG75_02245 [Acidobacteriota bacterium]PYX56056.1 MAG: hypothetical protein DMG73_16210 [Acidobacteriota bacterium]PYX66247.1 MAG: hypothetical protein DMG74_05325 [Acidobacteriota bacterium]
MKSPHLAAIFIVIALLVGCGAGHPKLVSIAVAPTTATATSSPQTTVGYTATGTFDNKTSRMLTIADGLTWKSSNTAIATIDTGGTATCIAPGAVTITASAPANLVLTLGTGVQNTSSSVNGTATLTCT